MKAAANYLQKQNPLMLAAGAALLIGLAYYLARRTVKDMATAAGGLVSGNNVITKDTPYEGQGVLGTLGGTINSALPFLDDVGSWIGGLIPVKGGTGDMLFYSVTFPDGARHAIGESAIQKDGTFTYEGRRYVLYMQDGKRYARAA